MDGWRWLAQLSEWFVVWNNRRSDERRLVIDPAISLHPSRQYFEWYKERTRQFLCNPSGFYDPRAVDIPPEAPVGYGDSLAVAWPDVPQDRRHLSSWVRHATQAQQQQQPSGDDLPQQPHQDAASPQHSPQGHSYELGSSSQVHDDTQDMCETAARNHGYWPTYLSFFEGLDQYIPTRPSPHTPADLRLTLSPSAMQAPLIQGRHSVSHIDTAGSVFRHYDPDAMRGRRLSLQMTPRKRSLREGPGALDTLLRVGPVFALDMTIISISCVVILALCIGFILVLLCHFYSSSVVSFCSSSL
ncbi:hypothetical protein PIB30_084836 [Stylosanthes scabra]|uniref:Uncharacterized protein n=1 Tax=Stylosanthes scabra TaxID=79078 RepID=A0ABU6RSY5_9FABA|nr:hypothetical protein [Stylosanthes scabra]